MRLFNLMKGLFGKPEENPDLSAPETNVPAAAPSPLAARPHAVMPSAARAIPMATRLAPGPAPAPKAEAPTLSTRNGELHLPLAVLVSSLPVELQGRVVTSKIATTTIALPLERVLPQLAQGAVRVVFGEIRQSAPDAFNLDFERDTVEITLPLGELVNRLAPALGGRRPQKRVEVPSDIASPFGSNGLGLKISPPEPKPALTSPRRTSSGTPVPPGADGRARGHGTPLPSPLAPSRQVSPTLPPPTTPATTNSGTTIFHRSTTPASPTPVRMTGGLGGNGHGNGNGHPGQSAPAPKPAASAPAPSLLVPLARISEAWPDAVRVEIGELNLGGAMVSLPGDQIEAGLKRGKVTFTWKTIRASIKPAALPSVSAHDNLALDLPLGVIAPLFLSLKKSSGGAAQKRVAVDEQIPNLFFGFPQPAAPAPAPAPA